MADPNTPAWLSDNVGGGAPAVKQDAIQTVPIDDAVAASGGANSAEVSSAPQAEEKDLPHVILMMRLANMGAAVALIACAVRTLRKGMEWNECSRYSIRVVGNSTGIASFRVSGTATVGFYAPKKHFFCFFVALTLCLYSPSLIHNASFTHSCTVDPSHDNDPFD
jgi:hypothetical protein